MSSPCERASPEISTSSDGEQATCDSAIVAKPAAMQPMPRRRNARQRGVQSRFYNRGRCSPGKERGVHHFHRLLCEFMAD